MAGSLKKKRHGLFLRHRYLSIYLLALVMPLFLCSLLYFFSMNVIAQQATQVQLAAQKYVIDAMDARLLSMDDLAMRAYRDNDIISLSNVDTETLKTKDVMRMLNARKRADYFLSNQIYSEQYFILFLDNGVIFTPGEVHTWTQLWYENNFNIEGLTFAQWFRMIKDNHDKLVLPMREMIFRGRISQQITYYIPLGSAMDGDQIVAVFTFSDKELDEIFAKSSAFSAENYILDQTGRVLYAQNGELQDGFIDLVLKQDAREGVFTQNNSILVYMTSPLNDWIYVSIMPLASVLGQVNNIRYLLTALIILAALVGLLLLWYGTRRVTHPIEAAFTLINQGKREGSERNGNMLTALVDEVGTIVADNDMLKQKLEMQNEQLQALYIERILTGRFDGNSEATGFDEKWSEFFSSGNLFSILLVKPEKTAHTNMTVSSLGIYCATLLENRGEGKSCHIHIFKDDELVLIFSGKSEADLKQKLSKFSQSLLSSTGGGFLKIGIGKQYADLREIRQSYQQAKYAISYYLTVQPGGCIHWAEEIPEDIQCYVYPISTELAIIDAVNAGRKQAVREILEQVYYDNFQANRLSAQMQRCLLYNVFCTFIRCVPLISLLRGHDGQELFRNIDNGIEEYEQGFNRLCETIITTLEQSEFETGENDDRIHKMLAYIHANYSLSSLDVSHIAGIFSLSENYFSQYFREQSGERFGEYLEKYRIFQSNQFLQQKDLTIAQVAEKVGYHNVNTFRRAYRRVMGVLPTVYRDHIG